MLIPNPTLHADASTRFTTYGLSIWLLASLILLIVNPSVNANGRLPLDKLKLPAGFSIAIYAEVENPRQLAIDDHGTLYAGSRSAGKVHAIRDLDQDGFAEQVTVIAQDLLMPSGIAIHDNHLFIAAVDKLYRSAPLSATTGTDTPLTLIFSDLPKDRHHGWKFIDFGPDDLMYIPVGAPCNICLSDDPIYASIQTLDLGAESLSLQPFALGVRNSVGFTWHPNDKALWFTDNGRDHLGDDAPDCELNIAPERGLHFGYPYEHGNGLRDPEFGDAAGNLRLRRPALALGPHVAPLGITFGEQLAFPEAYQTALFIAEHGSWNRSATAGHTGHRVTLAQSTAEGLVQTVFIEGWLQNNKAWGRPADVLVHPDGSLLIADDLANVIYRVTYRQSTAS